MVLSRGKACMQVVQRLENETSASKAEAAQAQEASIKQLKADHAAALDQVRDQ